MSAWNKKMLCFECTQRRYVVIGNDPLRMIGFRDNDTAHVGRFGSQYAKERILKSNTFTGMYIEKLCGAYVYGRMWFSIRVVFCRDDMVKKR